MEIEGRQDANPDQGSLSCPSAATGACNACEDCRGGLAQRRALLSGGGIGQAVGGPMRGRQSSPSAWSAVTPGSGCAPLMGNTRKDADSPKCWPPSRPLLFSCRVQCTSHTRHTNASPVERTEPTCPGRTESSAVVDRCLDRLPRCVVRCQVASPGAIESLDPAVGAAASLSVEVASWYWHRAVSIMDGSRWRPGLAPLANCWIGHRNRPTKFRQRAASSETLWWAEFVQHQLSFLKIK